MLIPGGYSRLRPDLGDRLKSARRERRLKQEALADLVGVVRETISKIENGREPRPHVLDALMTALDLEWLDVAEAGFNPSPRPFIDGARGDWVCMLGRRLREQRREENASLRNAAKRSGLSAAQLSRVERGLVRRSKIFST